MCRAAGFRERLYEHAQGFLSHPALFVAGAGAAQEANRQGLAGVTGVGFLVAGISRPLTEALEA